MFPFGSSVTHSGARSNTSVTPTCTRHCQVPGTLNFQKKLQSPILLIPQPGTPLWEHQPSQAGRARRRCFRAHGPNAARMHHGTQWIHCCTNAPWHMVCHGAWHMAHIHTYICTHTHTHTHTHTALGTCCARHELEYPWRMADHSDAPSPKGSCFVAWDASRFFKKN